MGECIGGCLQWALWRREHQPKVPTDSASEGAHLPKAGVESLRLGRKSPLRAHPSRF